MNLIRYFTEQHECGKIGATLALRMSELYGLIKKPEYKVEALY